MRIPVGRMTRSRVGLPPSYHGHAACREPDFMVHTEFGADVWTLVLESGFRSCLFVTFRYPSGVAIVARRVGVRRRSTRTLVAPMRLRSAISANALS